VLSLKGESNESMAETVLSMARSLVGSAISKAASAAANETSLLLGVEKDIWYVLHCALVYPSSVVSTSSLIFLIMNKNPDFLSIRGYTQSKHAQVLRLLISKFRNTMKH
jgi:hypothetical protein